MVSLSFLAFFPLDFHVLDERTFVAMILEVGDGDGDGPWGWQLVTLIAVSVPQVLRFYRPELRDRVKPDLTEDELSGIKRNVLDLIIKNVVPRCLLHRYIFSMFKSHEEVHSFRLSLGSQLGLASFLSFSLNIGDRTPYKIWLCRRSANIQHTDFYPSYASSHLIEHSDPVPFRLSPNLTFFIGPFILRGTFIGAFVSSAACWLRRQDVLKNYLSLFIRDDLLSWNQTLLSMTSSRS